MDIQVISIFWPWWIMLLWAWVWRTPVHVPAFNSSVMYPKVDEPRGNYIFVFSGTTILCPTAAAPLYTSISTMQRVGHDWATERRPQSALQKCADFSTPWPTLVIFWDFCFCFYSSHSNRCDRISHCGLGLHFPSDLWCRPSFFIYFLAMCVCVSP